MNILKINISRYPALILLSFSLCFFGCNSDDDISIAAGQFDNGVFIVNEGNFYEADGSLSFYDKATNTAKVKVFEEVNNKPLSGTFQSLSFYDGKGFLISSSGTIEVFTEDSLKSIASMTGAFAKPRFMTAINNKAYISDWGPYDADYNSPESFIVVMDIDKLEVIKTIEVASQPEELLAYNGNIYIASVASNVVTVINSTTDIAREIEVPQGPRAMELGEDGKIWVICNSGVAVSINTDTEEVDATITLVGDSPSGKVDMNRERNTLYYLTTRFEPDFSTINSVYAIDIVNLAVNPEPLISKKNLYGLGVDPETDMIYVADNHALQGNGTVIRFDADGTEIDNFPVGRNPNGFVFK